MADLPDGLVEFIGRYLPPTEHHLPDHIRMHPTLIGRLTVTLTPNQFSAARHGHADQLLGLRILADHTLEPGAWQVYARDNTLLRDSRSANPIGGPP